jgi:hypothetical protein
LKHNLGGPVVWWAGGDADYKSGGKLNSWTYGANSKIYQFYGEDEVHFIDQKPLNI